MVSESRLLQLTEMYFFSKTTTDEILKELTSHSDREKFKTMLRTRAIATANALCDVLDKAAMEEVKSCQNLSFALSGSRKNP